ncbi:MAG: hypothetical protein Q9195_001192 [Heterodermia aff. obscurata]
MAPPRVFAWESHVLYVEASRMQILPGGSTRYHPSRDVGVTPTDRTSFIPGQADWSPDNLPEVQYYLFPPRDRDAFRRKPVQNLKDAQGLVIYESWPTEGEAARPLRDFPVLPRQIGTQDYPWIIDAWRKLDPRIQGADVLMRMEPAGRPHRWNTFQQRLGRLRPDFNVVSWHTTRNDPSANIPTANVLSRLQPWHFEMNTTRGLTPGLLIPELGEDGGRVPLPDYEESRGFGREFQRRQGGTAGPAQTGRKRARRSEPQAQADRPSLGYQTLLPSGSQTFPSLASETFPPLGSETLPSSGLQTRLTSGSRTRPLSDSQDNEAAQDSDHSSDERPRPRRVRRRRRASPSPSLPPSPLLLPSRDSASPVRQIALQAPSVGIQQTMGIPPNQSQQIARVSSDPRVAPYPPGTIGGRAPSRQLSNFQLLGRSSTDATNVIQFSAIGPRDNYHPFTRMDLRNTQAFRPPLASHLSASVRPVPSTASVRSVPTTASGRQVPSTGNNLEEQRLRHFRNPGPSPFLTESQSSAERTGTNDDRQGYVDPFLERFFRQ